MNHAFRIIWSHTRQAFVVADEHASAQGKRSGARLLLAAAGAGLLAAATPALAGSGSCSAGSTSISTAVTESCRLNAGDTLNITDGGSITISADSNELSDAIKADMGFDSISNAGSIVATDGAGLVGIKLFASEGNRSGNSITNLAGGRIQGVASAIYMKGDFNNHYLFSLGSLTNAGTIESIISAAAIRMDYAEVGSFENQASGIIRGVDNAIQMYDAKFTGNFINRGLITSQSGYGINVEGGGFDANLENYGTINGADLSRGISLRNGTIGGDLINGENGVIEGGEGAIALDDSSIAGTLNNAGTLNGGEFGVGLTYGAEVAHIVNSGSIHGGSYGVGLEDYSTVGSIVNSGQITDGYYGVALTDSSVGQIENQAGGVIKGDSAGIYLEYASHITTLTNSGTIQGGDAALLDYASGLETLNIEGNNTARFIGDVLTFADISVKSGAVFGNDNAFFANSFTVEQNATLNMSHGAASYDYGPVPDGFSVQNGFFNQGIVALAAGETGTIYGNYTQTATGTLKIGVADDNTFGKLVVAGVASLESNAKIAVDVSNTGYSFSAQSLQDVLSASSTLLSDGTFAVTDNSTLFDFGAVKDGNTVDLTLTAAEVPSQPDEGGGLVEEIVTDLGNSPAIGAARVLDQVIASNPTGELASQFVGLSSEHQVSDAVTSTLPSVAASAASATGSAMATVNRVVQARQDGNSGLSSGDAPLAEDNLWVKTFGSWADQDERDLIAGFDADTQGLAIGADAIVSDDTRLGLAFAYAKTNLDSDSSVAPQSADIDSYLLIGYGSHALTESTELNFQLDIGQHRNAGQRYMPFADATAKADYDSHSVHAGLGIGHSLALTEQLTFVPSARIDYSWLDSESYHEKGAGALDLDVDGNDTEELLLSVEGKLDYRLTEATVVSASLGAGYDAIDEDSSLTSAYAGAPGATFSTPGLDREPWLARTGLGLTHTLDNGTEVSLRYDAEARSDFINQGASIKARWAF